MEAQGFMSYRPDSASLPRTIVAPPSWAAKPPDPSQELSQIDSGYVTREHSLGGKPELADSQKPEDSSGLGSISNLGSTTPVVSRRPLGKDGLFAFDVLVTEVVQSHFNCVLVQIDPLLGAEVNRKRRPYFSNARSQSVAVRLMVVGKELDTAVPTLVVFVASVLAKRVSKFFERAEIRDLLNPTELLTIALPSLVIPQAPRLRFSQSGVEAIYDSSPPSLTTLCGTPIRLQTQLESRMATLGGVVKLNLPDGDFCLVGMTAGHAVAVLENRCEGADALGSDGDFCDEWLSDYENFDSDGDDEDAEHDAGLDSTEAENDRHMPLSAWEFQDKAVLGNVMPSGLRAGPSCVVEKNYDWALVNLNVYKENILQVPEDETKSGKRKELQMPSTKLKPEELGLEAVIVSGSHGPKYGSMSRLPGKIQIPTGTRLVETYMFRLHDELASIMDGDSGSWVVDRETHEIFGHVVATDFTGDAYVVPIHDTFDDIVKYLKIESVSLPSNFDVVSASLKRIKSEQKRLNGASKDGSISGVSRSRMSISETRAVAHVPSTSSPGLPAPAARLERRPPPATPPLCIVRIRRLPQDVTEESIRLVLKFSVHLVDVEIVKPEEQEDSGYMSALLGFDDMSGAMKAKGILDSEWNYHFRGSVIVEIIARSIPCSRAHQVTDRAARSTMSAGVSSTGSMKTRSVWSETSIPSTADSVSPPASNSGSWLAKLGIKLSPQPLHDSSSHQASLIAPNFRSCPMNPPCNTLHVSQLPKDVSEEDMKATFAKCKGYRRLCFRTKTSGPVAFVEFEDVASATKVLNDFGSRSHHGGGISKFRLGYAKNPLGVRSGHTPTSISPAHFWDLRSGPGFLPTQGTESPHLPHYFRSIQPLSDSVMGCPAGSTMARDDEAFPAYANAMFDDYSVW